jgi:tetratricopeptide (TPR) repeat protein
MRILLGILATSSLALAQTPIPLDEAFFNRDRSAVLREVTERAFQRKEGDAKLLAEYGRACLAAMDLKRGKDFLQMAEAKESKDGEVLRLIALAWLKNGYKSEALAAYEQITRRDPKNKEALAQSAIDLAEVGLVAEADRYMKAYVQMEPEEWKAFLAFGRALLTSGHRKLASPWYARAVAIKPKEEKVLLEIMRAFTETQSVM